jgi:hypothetical protein
VDLTHSRFAAAGGGGSTQALVHGAWLRSLGTRGTVRLAGGTRVTASASVLEGGVAAWSGGAEALLALLGRRWLAGVTVSGGGVRTIAAVSHPVAGGALSLRREVGPLALEARAAATRSGATAYVDATAGAEARWGRVTIGAAAGRRWGDLADPLLQVHAELRAGRRLTLEAAAGTYPRDLTGFTRGRFVNVGVRVPLVRGAVPGGGDGRGVEIRPGSNGEPTRVVFALDGAARVDIVGEWNAWTPAPLTRVAAGRWQALLPLGRGAWRFSLVVDGERWVVPAGVPRLPDDFGGEVGVLVIDG